MTLLTNRVFIGFVLALVVLVGGGFLVVIRPSLEQTITTAWLSLLFGGGGYFAAKSNGNGNGYSNGSGNGGK
jgi:hypothetical protein